MAIMETLTIMYVYFRPDIAFSYCGCLLVEIIKLEFKIVWVAIKLYTQFSIATESIVCLYFYAYYDKWEAMVCQHQTIVVHPEKLLSLKKSNRKN